ISYATAYAGTPGTSYIARSVSAVAPTNTVYARVSATVRPSASGTFYFDDFYLKRNSEEADVTFKNATNSTTAFRIQSAGGTQTLLSANTTDNILKVGDGDGTAAGMTMLVLDSATTDPGSFTASQNGGVYYNSTAGSLKVVINGNSYDVCTTAVTCTGYSASAGSVVQLQASTPGTLQTGNFNITGTGILSALKSHDKTDGAGENLSIKSGSSTLANSKSGDITIDVGTPGTGGALGTISVGRANVGVVMGGNLSVQGTGVAIGTAGTTSGAVTLNSSAGNNSVTLRGPATIGNNTAYSLTFADTLTAGCMKINSSGGIYYQDCGVGLNFDLQDAYDNSTAPAEIKLAEDKNLVFTAQSIADVAKADPSVIVDLQCGSTCSTNGGRFAVQNAGSDVLTVTPTGSIIASGRLQVGSPTFDNTITGFQVDSFNGDSAAETSQIACNTTLNQGTLYYNTRMNSLRGCLNGAWADVSNPDTLGLLAYGIVPSSGNNPYDLPSLTQAGYSGPCKVSWKDANTVHVEPCTAYSSGRRINVVAKDLAINNASFNAGSTSLTTTARWGHVCVDAATNAPVFTSATGLTAATDGMPQSTWQTFDPAAPVVCLADVLNTTTSNGQIGQIYDTRTFKMQF
ncbi:hypothetical protein B7Z17_01805, partial [Candidatus Saccharibacteria bacterium 32-49-10]